MTNRTATFTFATPANPRVTQVTLGLNPVDSTTAKKATAVMTDIFKRVLVKVQQQSQDHYTKLMASKEFTVSFELPENEGKFRVNILYNEKNKIEFPLSEETCKSLRESLTVASPIKTSATLSNPAYLPNPQDLLLRNSITPLTGLTKPEASAKSRKGSSTTVASSTKASETTPKSPLLPSVQQNVKKIEKSTQSETAQTAHNFVYRFFAAIFNWVTTLFSSDTSKKSTPKYANLASKGQLNTQGSTSASATQTKTTQSNTAEAGKVAGIRPLRNGNNICFINAIFQALMNMPEIIPVLINAHNEKINKEAEKIALLEEEIAIEESSYYLPWSSSPDRVRLKNLEASREASITLNQALRTYNTDKKDFVWLNALRGFDPAFSGWSEQDACELLYHILDPLLELLRGGLNENGRPSMNIIPENIDSKLKTALSNFIPKFGTEREWVQKNDSTHKELQKGVSIASILPFEIPNKDTTLQALVTSQLELRPVPLAYDYTGDLNGIQGTYQASKERFVIQSLEGKAPEYVTLQFKRFNDDLSKNHSAITLPANNKITAVVDENNVNYEIHTLVMHRGDSPSDGHYFSYVRKNGAWIEANDSHVAPLTELPTSVEKNLYTAFLRRVH